MSERNRNGTFVRGHLGFRIKKGQTKNCLICSKNIYVKSCEIDRKKYCSQECQHKSLTLHSSAMKGRTHSIETRKKLSIGAKGQHRSPLTEFKKGDNLGTKNNAYKHGMSQALFSERQNAQGSSKYRSWRKCIFKRDNYSCQVCGKRGGNKEAHHINRWQTFPNERYDLNNGITVCKGSCHRQMDKLSYETEQRTKVMVL